MIAKHAVTPVADQFDLDEFVSPVASSFCPNDRLPHTVADERVAWRTAKRRKARAVSDRFEQGRLASAVPTGDDGETGRARLEARLLEVPKITELEPVDLAQETRTGINK